MIYANTTSNHPTHFLRGVDLIVDARTKFRVASENWPHPTYHRFGIPYDYYYAEMWEDGMDWQPSYWIIEQIKYEDPQILPFMIFDNHAERERFNDYDFKSLVKAMLHYRRDDLIFKTGDLTVFSDLVWPFIELKEDVTKHGNMKLFKFSHASQPETSFLANEFFIPDQYCRRREENEGNRGYWYPPEGFNRGIQEG
jgi:hypothetical protein